MSLYACASAAPSCEGSFEAQTPGCMPGTWQLAALAGLTGVQTPVCAPGMMLRSSCVEADAMLCIDLILQDAAWDPRLCSRVCQTPVSRLAAEL